MRVLFLCSQPPNATLNGTSQRLHSHIEAIARRHDVVLGFVSAGIAAADTAALARPYRRVARLTTSRRRLAHNRVGLPAAARLRDVVTSPRPAFVEEWRDPALIDQLRALAADGPYDVVWVQRSHLASAALAAGYRADIVDVDDVESQAFARRVEALGWYKSRPIDELEWMKIRGYEWSLTYRYPALVVCKEDDRRYFADARRVHVIPNGAAIPSVVPHAPADIDLLFVGTMSYWPNVDAVDWFLTEVLPIVQRSLPAATCCIAGRSASTLADRAARAGQTTVVSDPDDLAPLYARARVVVVPMRLGGGTCIKSIEALAYAKPLVATPAGAEGLGLVDGQHARIAGDADAFARACVEMLSAPNAANTMGNTGRAWVSSRYSWEGVGEEALRLVESTRRLRDRQ